MESITAGISKAVSKYCEGKKVVSIKDRGMLVHHHYEVVLDSGEVVFFKLGTNPEWSVVGHVANVAAYFKDIGIPAPRVLAVDNSCSLIAYPYIIQEKVGGTRLGSLLKQVDKSEHKAIYEVIGKLYGRMHGVKNDGSGLWGDEPRKLKYPVSPNDYMYNAEIVNGSGKGALDKGLISLRTYERTVAVWKENMDYLKDHQPSMVHSSPFPWNIYLERKNGQWHIAKLMAMGDVMWWDSAFDLAVMQYPPFGDMCQADWSAFLKGYGEEPQRKRILLYAVMQRLCTIMGTYMEPVMEDRDAWIREHAGDIDLFLEEIG
jgi:hypothetical protein